MKNSYVEVVWLMQFYKQEWVGIVTYTTLPSILWLICDIIL